MKLSVIIVNYNVRYFLEQALSAVEKAAAGMNMEVFVVDNNSVDNSNQMVREKFPSVNLIANKDNPGFAKANNQAIKFAKGQYILLLNPDTVIEEDTFTKCIQYMDENSSVGGLGVRMIDGSGTFLPESKRGFPSPFVAFCKAFGLSKLFPTSSIFNRYHLGFLEEDKTHEIDVLAGAFMMIRREVLDKIGLLDETFFMYGEDIDLSWRIRKAGFKNVYFPETTIIHYKGESTKKGSLNYVKTFYNAMIIFSEKHFTGTKAIWFNGIIRLAIYARGFLTLLRSWFKKIALPLFEAVFIYVGLLGIMRFWAIQYYENINYFESSMLWINLPLYTLLWLSGIWLLGSYRKVFDLGRLIRGIAIGTLVIAAVYGFLDMQYRSSRIVIVLGSVWTLLSTSVIRTILHFVKFGNFDLAEKKLQKLIIVGSKMESTRVESLLQKAGVQKDLVGIVHSQDNSLGVEPFLGRLDQLDEVVAVHKIDEIIFCSKDISSTEIMRWMTKLGPGIIYKIVTEDGLGIVGSNSKDASGELYTIDLAFSIDSIDNLRSKRAFDIILSIICILLAPFLLVVQHRRMNFIFNIFHVLIGKRSWVGYFRPDDKDEILPKIRNGVLNPVTGSGFEPTDPLTIGTVNLRYARDYTTTTDLDIVLRNLRQLGLN